MLTDCNGFAIRVYMYVIIGVFMFNSAAIWSAKRYSKNLAELSSASIGIAITTWIAAVTVLYNLDYRFWAVKHIAIIILSV